MGRCIRTQSAHIPINHPIAASVTITCPDRKNRSSRWIIAHSNSERLIARTTACEIEFPRARCDSYITTLFKLNSSRYLYRHALAMDWEYVYNITIRLTFRRRNLGLEGIRMMGRLGAVRLLPVPVLHHLSLSLSYPSLFLHYPRLYLCLRSVLTFASPLLSLSRRYVPVLGRAALSKLTRRAWLRARYTYFAARCCCCERPHSACSHARATERAKATRPHQPLVSSYIAGRIWGVREKGS